VRKLLVSGAAATLVAAVLVPSPANAVDDVNSKKFRDGVTVNGILAHLRVLQRIANNNDGTRASGTPGYDASVAYVSQRLKAAGYKVTLQEFTFPFFRDLAEPSVTEVSPTARDLETTTFTYSGSGEVTGTLVPAAGITIPPPAEPGTTPAGCDPADFAPAPAADAIALVQRGTCNFSVKAANAEAAGYDAVLIFNEGQPGRTDVVAGTLGTPFDLPVLGLSFEDGAALFAETQSGPVTVSVSASTESDPTRKTVNVIADSKTGDPDQVVVVGAHLDSVAAGPGINDNGSGTATNLEIAEVLASQKVKLRQKVRFAFWGAEELGLLGSAHYVASLSDDQLAQLYANLNFDMLGSPNYVRFVYDGDGSDTEAAGPPGSPEIEGIFNDYFASKSLPVEPTAFDGRSDYGPFIEVGVPAGGLFSGAEGVKSAEEAVVYGGTAGAPYDSCYHQACDTINNISSKALNELGDGAAHAVYTLVRTKSGLFDDERAAARTFSAQVHVKARLTAKDLANPEVAGPIK
jgi:Zn-dependent M28 family amino/carboxypeptidase